MICETCERENEFVTKNPYKQWMIIYFFYAISFFSFFNKASFFLSSVNKSRYDFRFPYF